MRNDELKHYGVKGMKWRQHKYKTRDGNDGDYGYDYGNNNSGSKYGYKTYRREYTWDGGWKNSWKGGYQSNRKAQKAVKKAASKTPKYAGLKNYKVVNMYGDEPVKPMRKKSDRRKTQSLEGDRKLSAMEIARNKARNAADNTIAKKKRQTKQKAKLSAEVRAKTLGEALGKVGKSVSVNPPIGKRKLKNQSKRATSDVMGGAVRSTKLGVKSANTTRKIKRSLSNNVKRFESSLERTAHNNPPVKKKILNKYTSSQAKSSLGDTISKSLNNAKRVAPKNAKKTGVNYMSESTKNKYKAKSVSNKSKKSVENMLKDFEKRNTKKKTSEPKGVNKFSRVSKSAHSSKSGLDSVRIATFNTAQGGFKGINNSEKKKKKKASNGLAKTVKKARKAGARKARQATINKGIKDWVKNALFLK